MIHDSEYFYYYASVVSISAGFVFLFGVGIALVSLGLLGWITTLFLGALDARRRGGKPNEF